MVPNAEIEVTSLHELRVRRGLFIGEIKIPIIIS
jgi:hypothetical protein